MYIYSHKSNLYLFTGHCKFKISYNMYLMFVKHGILYKPSLLGRVSICRGKKLTFGYKVIQSVFGSMKCSHLL